MKTTTVALSSVTLLNASYEPLGEVSFKQAVRVLFREVDVPLGRLLPDGSAEARPTPMCLLRPTGHDDRPRAPV